MEIKIDEFEVKNIKEEILKIEEKDIKYIKKEILNAGLLVERNAKENIRNNRNVNHGTLRRSVACNKVDDFSVVIGTNIEYASFIEYGTRAHEIRPINGKALKWKGPNGKYMFAKKVKHPGTKANPFLVPAFEDGIEYLDDKLEKILKGDR